MEPSKFVAFCPYRDEAIQRIDAYLNERQSLENDKDLDESFNRLATPGTPAKPEEPAPRSGYCGSGIRMPWYVLCCGWPESARLAADVLRAAREIVEASGIYQELSRLPDEVAFADPQDYHAETREAALQVKAILSAITPAPPVTGDGADPVTKRHRDKRHSPDFTEVTWHKKRYLFKPTQAKAVKILWVGWETGGATVSGAYIVKTLDLGSSRTLANVFRGHTAWGTLIVPVRGIKGAYCLNDPDDPALQLAGEEKKRKSSQHTGKRTGTRPGKRTGTRKK